MLILPFPCMIDSSFLLRHIQGNLQWNNFDLVLFHFHRHLSLFHQMFSLVILPNHTESYNFSLVVIAHAEPGVTYSLQTSYPSLSEGLFDRNEVFFNCFYLISNGLKMSQVPYFIKQLSQTHRPGAAYRFTMWLKQHELIFLARQYFQIFLVLHQCDLIKTYKCNLTFSTKWLLSVNLKHMIGV